MIILRKWGSEYFRVDFKYFKRGNILNVESKILITFLFLYVINILSQ